MNKQDLAAFVREHMMREGEVLPRDPEWKDPFAVALVTTAAGAHEVRIAQPVVLAGRRDSNLPDVLVAGVYGRDRYPEAARRMNRLIDEQL